MKILIIGTDKSRARLLMNGISTQGYEFLDNPFKIDEYQNNWFNFENYFKTNKFVVKINTLDKPYNIPNYLVFISQFIRQFDKIILLDKIIEDNDSQKDIYHKDTLKKISELTDNPIIFCEKLFSKNTMEQFEVINKLELDLDSFSLQEYLDPNKNNSVI